MIGKGNSCKRLVPKKLLHCYHKIETKLLCCSLAHAREWDRMTDLSNCHKWESSMCALEYLIIILSMLKNGHFLHPASVNRTYIRTFMSLSNLQIHFKTDSPLG